MASANGAVRSGPAPVVGQSVGQTGLSTDLSIVGNDVAEKELGPGMLGVDGLVAQR
jgi:hypothetical protein